MGRTLQNTMVNLALENACDEAVYQVQGPGPLGIGMRLWTLNPDHHCNLLSSWGWTWRNWRRLRKMRGWATGAWAAWQVGGQGRGQGSRGSCVLDP